MANSVWQPRGAEEFAAACRVCRHRVGPSPNHCDACKAEHEPGFEFDPVKYMRFFRELTMAPPDNILPTYDTMKLQILQKTLELIDKHFPTGDCT